MKFINSLIIRSPAFPLNKTINSPLFAEGIYLTSPTLYNEYQKLLLNVLTDKKEIQKLNVSIYKYQTRASSRCTPFGLFAGIGIGEFKTQNCITLDSNLKNILNRKTRLDMNVLCILAQELSKQDSIKRYLNFYPNNSIYQIERHYRYVEYYYHNTQRVHKLSKVDFSEYLKLVFNEAKGGKTLKELSNLLVSDDILQEEAEAFINELVSSQLLISELEPTVTGLDFFDVILKVLDDINKKNTSNELSSTLEILNRVKKSLAILDKNKINDIAEYQHIFNSINSVLPTITETNLFQTDLFIKTDVSTIDTTIQETILNALVFLNKITPLYKNKTLTDFKNRFNERYEDYEIPLLQALDTETGIGYSKKDTNGINNLIDDLYISSEATDRTLKWNNLQAVLHQLITKSIKENKTQIKITEQDFQGIDFSTKKLPHSLSVMFKVINQNTNKIILTGAGGSSAINLLGRFAHGNLDILNIVKVIAQHEQEQSNNNILAEVVHLPESRVGNILSRPIFREYEIPYLSKSSVDKDFQIEASDLFISIKNDEIILRSKRMNYPGAEPRGIEGK